MSVWMCLFCIPQFLHSCNCSYSPIFIPVFENSIKKQEKSSLALTVKFYEAEFSVYNTHSYSSLALSSRFIFSHFNLWKICNECGCCTRYSSRRYYHGFSIRLGNSRTHCQYAQAAWCPI